MQTRLADPQSDVPDEPGRKHIFETKCGIHRFTCRNDFNRGEQIEIEVALGPKLKLAITDAGPGVDLFVNRHGWYSLPPLIHLPKDHLLIHIQHAQVGEILVGRDRLDKLGKGFHFPGIKPVLGTLRNRGCKGYAILQQVLIMVRGFPMDQKRRKRNRRGQDQPDGQQVEFRLETVPLERMPHHLYLETCTPASAAFFRHFRPKGATGPLMASSQPAPSAPNRCPARHNKKRPSTEAYGTWPS